MPHGRVIPAALRAARASAAAAILLTATTAVSGCGRANTTGVFQDAGGQPSCQVHQSTAPARDYTGGEGADTQAILTMMRYLTAHGTQPYCDGRPPSPLDKTWSALYLRLSGR